LLVKLVIQSLIFPLVLTGAPNLRFTLSR